MNSAHAGGSITHWNSLPKNKEHFGTIQGFGFRVSIDKYWNEISMGHVFIKLKENGE